MLWSGIYRQSADILAKVRGEVRSVVTVARHSAKNKSCILLFQSRMFTTTSGPSWRKTREVIEPSPSPRRPSTWTQLITQCGEPAARMPHTKQYKIQKKKKKFFFFSKPNIYICHCVALGCVQALQKSTVTGVIKGPKGGDEVHHSHHRGATQELPSLVKKNATKLLLHNTMDMHYTFKSLKSLQLSYWPASAKHKRISTTCVPHTLRKTWSTHNTFTLINTCATF